jgi:epoxyqueuosine reductase
MTPPSSRDHNEPPGESIRRTLLAAGFDRVGFAAAGETPRIDRFHRWLKRGHAASMDYLGRTAAKRADPRLVLAGTQTVIVLALHYSPEQSSVDSGLETEEGDLETVAVGRVAAYARGEDYHKVMEKRLKRLCDQLRETHPARYRYYVDTGPVLERAWAHEAGVGWIGKNTCAIDPGAGSYFFLGVILTSLELPPDAPATDHCGNCTLCLDACPTDAFAAPYELDAQRCISYLTIEHRGEVNPALADRFDDWIFGCDVCQEVCPFNHPPADLPGDPELQARQENHALSLDDLVHLDTTGFQARFPRSAVRRAKSEGFLRNVLIAIGNSGTANAARILEAAAVRPVVQASSILSATLRRAQEKLRRR